MTLNKRLQWTIYTNGVGSCSALGGHCTLSGHNLYGENNIPMEGHQKLGGHQPPLPPGSYAYVYYTLVSFNCDLFLGGCGRV